MKFIQKKVVFKLKKIINNSPKKVKYKNKYNSKNLVFKLKKIINKFPIKVKYKITSKIKITI